MADSEQVALILQLVILALVLYLLFTQDKQCACVPAEELTPLPEELAEEELMEN